MAHYRSGIWGKTKKAIWKQRVSTTSEMEATNSTAFDICRFLKRAQNWKAPGPDIMPNFLYKHLTCVHPVLVKCMQNIIKLLAAVKFQYKWTSYKMQNLYIKSLDISGRVPDLTAGRYIDQPCRQRKVQCKKFFPFVMKVWEGISM